MEFPKITLVGVGLLGGSVGLAVKQRGVAGQVTGYVRRAESVEECLATGAVDEATQDLEAAVTGASLVILCTPVGDMEELAAQLKPHLSADVVITDVGSVKASVVHVVESVLPRFVGSHPMCGSEKAGVAHARGDLFEGAACAITPTDQSEPTAVETVSNLWTALGSNIPTPFPRIPFEEVMNRWGSDKPDTRFDMELVDMTDDFASSEFKVFSSNVAKGGVVKALNAKGFACVTQGQMETMTDYAKSFGAKGLAFIKVENGEWKSPIVKFFSDPEKAALQEKLNIEEGDLILFAADNWLNACEILGKIRLYCAEKLSEMGKMSIPADRYNFLWVVEFPLLMFDKEMDRWYSSHHPFTSPVEEDIPKLSSDPKSVRGQHYDIVVNGVELGGGSIRIHQRELQKTIFEDLLQIPADVAKERFGYMLEAFRFGAPPHGGIALGFDRLIAMLCDSDSIREVIAFPKTAKGADLMSDAPGSAEPKQLRDLHINLRVTKQEKITPEE